MKEIKDMNYNELISELESVVKELENNSLELEKSVELYKKGLDLTAECEKRLNSAKEQVVKVVENKEEKDFE